MGGAFVNASAGSVGRWMRMTIPIGMFLREYYRAPLNVVLLAIIPVLLIYAVGSALSRLAGLFQETLTTAMGQSMGAIWAAAFLTGITGFFMMTGARSADRRLVRTGYRPLEIVGLRFATVGLVALLTTTVSFVVLLTKVEPTNVAQTLLVIYLGALIYGAVGILIGSLVHGELEGSFAIMFFFVEDAFIGSPLFGAESSAFVLLPTYYPTKILLALTAEQPHAAVHWLHVALYLIIVGGFAGLAFYRTARVRR